MQSSAYTYIPASDLSFRQMAKLINHAYADYYLRVSLGEGQFEQMCIEEDMRLEHSVVAVSANGDPVGMTMLSVRGHAAWISGVGVLPEHRRQGLARRMVSYVVQRALDFHIRDLRLEVLTQNIRALPLYEDLGFVKERELLVLSQNIYIPVSHRFDPTIYDIDVEDALSHYHDFHRIHASWQRGYASLKHRARRLSAIGHTVDDILKGYVLFESRGDTFAIADIAISHEESQRVHAATLLLQTVQARHPNGVGYTVNIPAEDPLVEAFTNLKYRIWHQQFEMVYQP